MIQQKQRTRWAKGAIYLCLIAIVFYGSSRLYFKLTGGFCLSNITSDFAFDPRWETRPLTEVEQLKIDNILAQKFTYLGKGCQSYVFQSGDGEYVIKFFKYQRFRPQFMLKYLTFIPAVANYYDDKIEKKKLKLDTLFASWKIAFEDLQPETGLVYVHLNKTDHLAGTLTIYDKMGFEHILDMNQMEFLIQKKACMLCSTVDAWMSKGEIDKTKKLLSKLIAMVLSEYHRGLADNDHALMQNTGVYREDPVHVDVGQFVRNEEIKDPANYRQELFNKAYKFRAWLQTRHPELLQHVDNELKLEMGDSFAQMKHIPKKKE